MYPRCNSSNLVTGCGWRGRRIVSMATIKKDHTLPSHWRDMMDDYLKVWQVLQWWGGSHYIFPALPPSLCLSLPHSAYLGQCFNTPLTWLYWHTPDSVWWLMSVWVPLLLSLSLSVSSSLCSSSPCYPVFTVRAVQSSLSHTQDH